MCVFVICVNCYCNFPLRMTKVVCLSVTSERMSPFCTVLWQPLLNTYSKPNIINSAINSPGHWKDQCDQMRCCSVTSEEKAHTTVKRERDWKRAGSLGAGVVVNLSSLSRLKHGWEGHWIKVLTYVHDMTHLSLDLWITVIEKLCAPWVDFRVIFGTA